MLQQIMVLLDGSRLLRAHPERGIDAHSRSCCHDVLRPDMALGGSKSVGLDKFLHHDFVQYNLPACLLFFFDMLDILAP